MQVVVGVNVRLFPDREFLGCDIVAPAPPDKAIIGRGVCAAVTMNISNALLTLTPLGIIDETEDVGWVWFVIG